MMKNLFLSVVIPTFNRKNILRKCLYALFDQIYPKSDYEIIIIDDGSTDGTEELVKSLLNNSPCILRYFKQANKGPASARNVGIRNAWGEIILFIGDDIIATPTLLEEHFRWHQQYPEDNVAVLGYVTWSPEIQITPFMKWLENGGPQFHFWQIENKNEVDPQSYFYTSNISIKREFILRNNGFFDEDFPYAAYEDIELGHRLKEKGMILKYNNKAVGYHYHYVSLDDACQRMIRVGESSQILAKKLGKKGNSFPPLNISLLRGIVSMGRAVVCYPIAKFYETRAVKGIIFGYVMSYYTHVGIRRYWNKTK